MRFKDEPPDYYPQIQTMMEILSQFQIQKCFFVEYDPRPSPEILSIKKIGYDPLFFDNYCDQIQSFYNQWQLIKQGEAQLPPESEKVQKNNTVIITGREDAMDITIIIIMMMTRIWIVKNLIFVFKKKWDFF